MASDVLLDLTGVVVLRKDLLAAGYTDRQIQTRVKAGELHRVRHGSYCDKSLWDSLGAADRHRVLARAVLARAHPTTVLTHVSSAIEHGAPVWGHDLTKVHTTRTDGRSGRKECDRVQTPAPCRRTTSRSSTASPSPFPRAARWR
ncbi:type IV toxin-antitoxin system AbiEi family antitoxin domain-containing protein [Nocardioides sp. SYSU D00065]|uniref:type IV toxin-antitoxin system AbiEi family antitoxin domain-containing protein n=1 Tax=Nocardioides sp. SYSU D00065 TaxID=2817378 RepID=UPI001B345236|nr:type IV toxin-antitoxin system AbiEi family antitoxin domain-containing protein [Nocardioides sp. SYSU D00065]